MVSIHQLDHTSVPVSDCKKMLNLQKCFILDYVCNSLSSPNKLSDMSNNQMYLCICRCLNIQCERRTLSAIDWHQVH